MQAGNHELQNMHLKVMKTAQKQLRDAKGAVKFKEMASFWLLRLKYMYKMQVVSSFSLIFRH
ncbi:hypothetical protein SD70_30410 [Gordoniibacillus kamchatkensis]|uniref:Uncharacterized protein n=2 Tax=Gordoniibacillus kamchatkensis TaxID=1590651 RepID=A0ABR5AA13_9BACL|nr:hypothetical protein SD70_30410 [Paenibacillus sp. VKM B-2647]